MYKGSLLRKMHSLYVCVVLGCVLMFGGLVSKGDDQLQNQQETSVTLVADLIENEAEEAQVSNDDEDEDVIDPNMEPFIPTKEWQTVKRGQSIPAGLHVRMNLQTKQREAKLMEGDDGLWLKQNREIEISTMDKQSDRMQAMKQGIQDAIRDLNFDSPVDVNSDKSKALEEQIQSGRMAREEMREALKNFKMDQDDVKNPEALPKRESFRSAEELKEELAKLNMNIKTDMEVLQEYMNMYKNGNLGEEAKVGLLNNMEYYLHQLDNAMDFVDLGGLEVIVSELNNTSPAICAEAALVIGSAAQSNPYVQRAALDLSVPLHLSRLISTDMSPSVLSPAVYALSSVLRGFPEAQSVFLGTGQGEQVLMSLFREDRVHKVADSAIHKVQLKAAMLLSDLLEEKKSFQENHQPSNTDEFYLQKKQLYDQILVHHSDSWCSDVSGLLSLPSHDSRDKVLTVLLNLCNSAVKADDTLAKVRDVRQEYVLLASEEEAEGDAMEDRFFTHMLHKINTLLDLDHITYRHTDL